MTAEPNTGFDVSSPAALEREERFVLILKVAMWAAAFHAAYILYIGLWQPLLDLHSFRQTQTAISVYWLLHGGSWFAYETPVLGAPWSIPFEFPVFEWFVALVAATGIPLDGAGRLVSFSFFVATLWPLNILFRATKLGRVAFLSTAILFLTAPLYVYWSRTFMIESCALFFSCLALALLASYLQQRTLTLATGAIAAGAVATLAKATTFPAFAFVGGCLVLFDLRQRLMQRDRFSTLLTAIGPAIILVLPFVFGYAWVIYSDHLKTANELGGALTSANLINWNFGSGRLSAALWNDTILKRALPDLFGFAVVMAAAAAGAALPRPRFALAAIVAGIGFLVPFAVFTNLHIIHDYYQYANGIFAIAAVGIGIASIVESHRRVHYLLAGALLAAIVVSQVAFFVNTFKPVVRQDFSQSPRLQAALLVKERTPDNSSVLVFGDDWASTIPYYADRKGLAVPAWAWPSLIDQALADPQHFLGDRPLGAIVLCRDQLSSYTDHVAAIEQFVGVRDPMGEFGVCQVFGAKLRSSHN